MHLSVVRLAAAVHETLSPFMSKVRERLAAIEENVKEEIHKQNLTHTMGQCGYECGSTGGWRRVVYLDITNYNTNCPSGWNLTFTTARAKRACCRFTTTQPSCDSAFFPVGEGDYTSVCGSIIAYAQNAPNDFEAYHNEQLMEPMLLV